MGSLPSLFFLANFPGIGFVTAVRANLFFNVAIVPRTWFDSRYRRYLEEMVLEGAARRNSFFTTFDFGYCLGFFGHNMKLFDFIKVCEYFNTTLSLAQNINRFFYQNTRPVNYLWPARSL